MIIKRIIKKEIKKFLQESYFESLKPVDGYVESEELIGKHVWVHTNRTNANNGHNGLIGVYESSPKGRKIGSPIAYTNSIHLKAPIYFQTSEKGAERIRKTGHRTLIAGVSGVVVPENLDATGFIPIAYSNEVGYFFEPSDPNKHEVISADEVIFWGVEETRRWKIYAKNPIYRPKKENNEDAFEHSR